MTIDIYHRRAKYNLIHAQLNIKYYLQSIKLAACYVYCYTIIHLLDFKCISDGYDYIAVVKNTYSLYISYIILYSIVFC